MNDLFKENVEKYSEKNKAFVAKWKNRLCGTLKEGDDWLYSDSWASCGNGSYIEINGIHGEWYDKLDQYLTDLSVRCSDFKIFQLKLKYGGIRLYLQDVPNDERMKADQIGLYDEALIW